MTGLDERYSNPEFVRGAIAKYREKQVSRAELHATREKLETPSRPTDFDVVDEAARIATDGGEPVALTDGDVDEFDATEKAVDDVTEAYAEGELDDDDLEEELETALDDPDSAGFRMTDRRRVGTVSIEVTDGTLVPFGKPSGRASVDLLGRVEALEEGGASIPDMGEYVWSTLAEWSLDDEKDADWYADELSLVEAINTTRTVALGGAEPGK